MHTGLKSACVTILCGALLALATALTACAPFYNGEKLFFNVGCSQCHFFKGRGGGMGPDLTAVANNRNDSWIDSYLQDPAKIYPMARMPSFKHLSHAERKAIIAFLKQ